MRPYFVLVAAVVMTAAAFGQQPLPYPGACFTGCGPYIPLLTTPEISLQTASPNPVGATNATTGLVAGATNSTLSEIQGSTNSVYTVPVWYQGGGAPIITPEVRLYPETIGREGHVMHGPHAEGPREGAPREEARTWMYFSGREHTVSLGSVAKGKKADHVYTNEDITRENEKNGEVKYDGKTEKM
jgi:hypothetical protein